MSDTGDNASEFEEDQDQDKYRLTTHTKSDGVKKSSIVKITLAVQKQYIYLSKPARHMIVLSGYQTVNIITRAKSLKESLIR